MALFPGYLGFGADEAAEPVGAVLSGPLLAGGDVAGSPDPNEVSPGGIIFMVPLAFTAWPVMLGLLYLKIVSHVKVLLSIYSTFSHSIFLYNLLLWEPFI